MKVTILTVCYNNQKTILETLNSVLSQTYKNIEHIIVDGESTDKTISYLKNYPFKNKRIFKIKKKGVYNALNYGIKKATGDILHILHADDIYHSNDIISSAIKIIRNRKEKIFTSDIAYFKKNNFKTITRFYSAKNFKTYFIKFGLMPPHPGFFLKKDIYKNFLYDESYKIAGDFDFVTRVFLKKKIKFFYLNLTSVRMRVGGLSSKNIYSYLTSTMEILKTFKKNNLKSNLMHSLVRIPSKIFQLFIFNSKKINNNFKLTLTEFYKKFKKYDFIIKNKLNYLDLNKNFIYSAMNLAFLSSYANNDIKKSQYLINWSDGVFSKSLCDINLKIPGRQILKSLQIPKNIKKITVFGNLSSNGKLYLQKKFKVKISNIYLKYGPIKLILKKLKYKTSKNELIFTTLPTPKQEILANYIAKNNKYFKIICIGGSISIVSGDEKAVPNILYNFEFLWRLRYETRRRVKRLFSSYYNYIIGKYINKSLNNLEVIYEI
jgi:glycosyltransferase involved in cell wall biosynthesis